MRICFLCNGSKRVAQKEFMTIKEHEQQRRIQNGYVKRHKIEITSSLIGKDVHRKCFRSILRREPLARIRSKPHPRKCSSLAKQKRHQSQSNPMVMIDPAVCSVAASDPVNSILSDSSLTVDNDKEVKFTEKF